MNKQIKNALNRYAFILLIGFIFLLMIISPMVKADSQLPIFCGGDKELLIPCIGDQEINILGIEPNQVGGTGGDKGNRVIEELKNFNYLYIIIFIFILAFLVLILFFIKRKKDRKNGQ